jgi:hypothetical protein
MSRLGELPSAHGTQPGELLFEFVREFDHAHFCCELSYHGEYGVEAQFLKNGELLNEEEKPFKWLCPI